MAHFRIAHLLRPLGVAICVFLTLVSPARAQGEPVEVIFLDVGQGDAVLIRAPEGQTALIDAGPGVDIVSALTGLGVEALDLVVASHPHADHIGGMWRVLQSLPVRFYMDNGQPHTTTTYQNLLRTLESRPEITYLEAVPRTLTLGSVSIHVLPLPSRRSSNLNNGSVGLLIEHGAFTAFLSGDSERPELQHFIDAGVVPDVTLFKAPHHGSDDAVSERFLAAARPEIVVISVGWANGYGHPSVSALSTYPRYADAVLRTDVHGTVTVTGFEDGTYAVSPGETEVARGRPHSARSSAPPAAATPMEEAEKATSAFSISVFADAPGNDHQNPNGEYAMVANQTGQVIDVSGWRLCDAARHCFIFPPDASIPANGVGIVHTGFGAAGDGRFFMGSGSAVWNNDGDVATLYDRSGRVVARYSY